MKNLNCSCGGKFELAKATTGEGASYESYCCNSCGEELLDLKQAEALYRELENIYNVKLSKWGESLAVRIPAGVVRSLHLKPKQKARVIPEKNSFRVVPV